MNLDDEGWVFSCTESHETLYMQWLGSGAGVNIWKSSRYARCVGSLKLGGRMLTMFRGGVNRKHICGKQTIMKRQCTNMKHIVYYCDHLSGCRLCDANWSRCHTMKWFHSRMWWTAYISVIKTLIILNPPKNMIPQIIYNHRLKFRNNKWSMDS